MDFLERLRRYLERVGQARDGLPYVAIDTPAHRRFLLETIEQHWGREPHEAARVREKWKRGFYNRPSWDNDDPFEAFIQSVAIGVLDELEPAATTNRLAELIDTGILIELGVHKWNTLLATSGPPINNEILLKIVLQASGSRDDVGASDGWLFPPRYAFATRLIQRRGENVVLSRCGEMLLKMPGIDGVRWLLTLEAALAVAPADILHLSPELALLLVSYPEYCLSFDWGQEPWGVNLQFLTSTPTIRRLGAFGLLQHHVREIDDEYLYVHEFEWHINERHRNIFEDIAQRRLTPHAILADALLRDETIELVQAANPSAAGIIQESSAATLALHAQMVVHEIRNALIPAQTAFSLLAGDLFPLDQPDTLKRMRRVEHGIERALDFVDGILRVANLGVEQPSTFDFADALRDACASISRELNGGFQQNVDGPQGRITGPRTRFVLAVTNLLRNAAQSIAGVPNGRVAIKAALDDDHVIVHVDDSGAGVPAAQRSAIFEPGVTMRSGGSGQGLALVQKVVQGEMRGTVQCTDGPLGGARFTIRIPLRAKST